MRVSFAGQMVDLSYCTNIHPGESWAETLANLRTHTEAIRARVCLEGAFGIGLRLSHRAAEALASGNAMAEFLAYLKENNFYVFTVNAFPYGQFHATKIKENVFSPDWTRGERLKYTNQCADLLCRMLPEGGEGSISTLPGSFKGWIETPEQERAMIANMAACAFHLHKIFLRTGRRIHLGFEPEPMGLFETIDETVEFFTRRLWPEGSRMLIEDHGLDEAEAVVILREHLGMCYDTCHMAIEYESAESALQRLSAAGILLSKVQVSSALRLTPGAAALAELERFADGVYLHQVLGRKSDGSIVRWKDIAPALAAREELMACEELRVHCHVPLYMTAHGEIGSTAEHIRELFSALRNRPAMVRHFEVETYTWDVLPPELRTTTMDEAVAREMEWTLARMSEA